jgi:hypothetical protein
MQNETVKLKKISMSSRRTIYSNKLKRANGLKESINKFKLNQEQFISANTCVKKTENCDDI